MNFQSRLVSILGYNADLATLVVDELKTLIGTDDLTNIDDPLVNNQVAAELYDAVWAAANEDSLDNGQSNLLLSLDLALSHNNSPWGYRRINNGQSLTIFEPEAAVVRLAHRWYTELDYSLRDIGNALTAMAIPTHHDMHRKARRGYWRTWYTTPIDTMLSSPVYIGQWHKMDTLTGEFIVVEVPPILDQAAFQAAHRQRVNNTNQPRHEMKHDYLLAQRVRCGVCGRPAGVHANRVRGNIYRLYYRCPTTKCPTRGFRAEETDTVVWRWMEETLRQPDAAELLAHAHRLKWEARAEDFHERINVIDLFLNHFNDRLEQLRNWPLPHHILRDARMEYEGEVRDAIVRLLEARQRVESDLHRHHEHVQFPLGAAAREFAIRCRVVELLDVYVEIAGRNANRTLSITSRVGSAQLNL